MKREAIPNEGKGPKSEIKKQERELPQEEHLSVDASAQENLLETRSTSVQELAEEIFDSPAAESFMSEIAEVVANKTVALLGQCLSQEGGLPPMPRQEAEGEALYSTEGETCEQATLREILSLYMGSPGSANDLFGKLQTIEHTESVAYALYNQVVFHPSLLEFPHLLEYKTIETLCSVTRAQHKTAKSAVNNAQYRAKSLLATYCEEHERHLPKAKK